MDLKIIVFNFYHYELIVSLLPSCSPCNFAPRSTPECSKRPHGEPFKRFFVFCTPKNAKLRRAPRSPKSVLEARRPVRKKLSGCIYIYIYIHIYIYIYPPAPLWGYRAEETKMLSIDPDLSYESASRLATSLHVCKLPRMVYCLSRATPLGKFRCVCLHLRSSLSFLSPPKP